jgi:lipopolysaccharide biosynthesis regulator YciM
MSFDLSWLLWVGALAFGLGWMASRLDLRQWQRAQRETRRAYDQGLNLLLNEQHDKAIDAFIEVVQQDPDATELHFALGNLFRRRGELERAVRLHEYLLQRPHLNAPDRQRAQRELARDFLGGGLFDRAESAWKALLGTPFEPEARRALLTLHERAREWPQAAEAALWLQAHGAGAYSPRVAHHHCERAQEYLQQGEVRAAQQALEEALQASPHAPRPLLMQASLLRTQGQTEAAMSIWMGLAERQDEAFTLALQEFSQSLRVCGHGALRARGFALLLAYAEAFPTRDAAQALSEAMADSGHADGLNGSRAAAARLEHLRALLSQRPSARGAQALVQALAESVAVASALAPTPQAQPGAVTPAAPAPLAADLNLAAQALNAAARARYRCAACGFETQRHFWQCPGCLSWDSFPARCVDES